MASPTKSKIRATYARIATSFAATRKEPWPEVTEFLRELPAGSRVVDIGCGNGRHLLPAVALGHRAIGLDFARELLAIGWGSAPNPPCLDRIEAEAASLPLMDGCMDACLCVAVLHHLPTRDDRIAVLQEIRRVLVPGGRAFVSVWDVDQDRFRGVPRESDRDVEVPWSLPDGTKVPRYYHLFTQEELEALIIESGLHGERFFRASGNVFVRASKDGGPRIDLP